MQTNVQQAPVKNDVRNYVVQTNPSKNNNFYDLLPAITLVEMVDEVTARGHNRALTGAAQQKLLAARGQLFR